MAQRRMAMGVSFLWFKKDAFTYNAAFDVNHDFSPFA